MLYILILGVNPSTRVGISDLKVNIRATKLVQFQFNVIYMFDNTMSNYDLIIDRGGQCNGISLDLYTALLSSKNDVFNIFVKHIKDDWEVGSHVTHSKMLITSVKNYNNMVKQGRWKQQ